MTMTTEEFKQINKLHVLAQVAVDDMEILIDDDYYRPRWYAWADKWAAPSGENFCSICLAGAVMANTLECGDIEFKEMEDSISSRLDAIDHIRQGEYLTSIMNISGELLTGEVARELGLIGKPSNSTFLDKGECRIFIDDMKKRIIPELEVLDV